MHKPEQSRIRFGTFDIDPASGELRKAGRSIRLQELPFRMLMALLERPGQVVTRMELCERLWGDTNVEFEDGLNTAVRKLREALGDSASNPRFVETLPRRGYRFIAPVTQEQPTPELDASAAPPSEIPSQARSRSRSLLVALVALIIFGAVSAWMWRRVGETPTLMPTRPMQLTRDSGLSTEPSVSRDGRLVAYASDRDGANSLDIWAQYVSDRNARRLVTHPADDHHPDISPDGATIAFRSERDGGGIYTVPSLGGDVRLLIPQGSVPRFSPDGSEISYSIGTTGTGGFWGKLYVFSRADGTSRRLAPDLLTAGPTAWSPDGKFLVFAAAPIWTEAPSLWICSRTGDRPTKMSSQAIFEGGAPLGTIRTHSIAWFHDHIIVSMREGDTSSIWAAPVSTRTNTVAGEFKRITFGSGNEWLPSVSTTGMLAFASHNYTADLWEITPPAPGRGGGMRRLTHDNALNYGPSLSADARQMVYVSNRSGNFEVWRRDLATGADAALTQTAINETSAAISRDGMQVAFGDGQDLYVVGVSGGTPKLLAKKHSRPYDWWFSALVIGRDESGRARSRLASWHPERGERSLITDHASLITISPHLSPDGKWITFHTSDSVNRQVMVASYDGSLIPESKWIRVTDGKALDREPRWSSDGKSVYFLSDRDGFRCVWARDLESSKKPTRSIYPFVHLHSARLSLTHVPNTGHVSVSSVGDKLILAIGELTGNIWITELQLK